MSKTKTQADVLAEANTEVPAEAEVIVKAPVKEPKRQEVDFSTEKAKAKKDGKNVLVVEPAQKGASPALRVDN